MFKSRTAARRPFRYCARWLRQNTAVTTRKTPGGGSPTQPDSLCPSSYPPGLRYMTTFAMAGISDPGMVRERNEDALLLKPESGLAVLADGMGGHLAGEVASAMAVDIIGRSIVEALDAIPGKGATTRDRRPEDAIVVDAIQQANAAIYESACSRAEYSGMGTTVVVALFYDNKVCVAHVGDSRLYRYRAQQLEQLTEDHSMVQELLRRGLLSPEEARTSTNKNLVTRALGVEPLVQVDIVQQMVNKDDLYVLCSDGLSDVLPDSDIELLLQTLGRNLDDAVRQIVTEVNSKGGPDNVSVVLVRTGKRFARRRSGSGPDSD